MIGTVDDWDRAFLWRFRAVPWRILDGDTFIALPDCGFGVAALPHIRLLDFNAVELRDAGGQEAKQRLADVLLVQTDARLKWTLRIESKIKERVIEGAKTFERFVATVYVVQPDGTLQDVRELLA